MIHNMLIDLANAKGLNVTGHIQISHNSLWVVSENK